MWETTHQWHVRIYTCFNTVVVSTPPNFHIDTKNDGLEAVSVFKNMAILSIFLKFQGGRV